MKKLLYFLSLIFLGCTVEEVEPPTSPNKSQWAYEPTDVPIEDEKNANIVYVLSGDTTSANNPLFGRYKDADCVVEVSRNSGAILFNGNFCSYTSALPKVPLRNNTTAGPEFFIDIDMSLVDNDIFPDAPFGAMYLKYGGTDVYAFAFEYPGYLYILTEEDMYSIDLNDNFTRDIHFTIEYRDSKLEVIHKEINGNTIMFSERMDLRSSFDGVVFHTFENTSWKINELIIKK